jgi:type II secretory pathway pseudopilin PulG
MGFRRLQFDDENGIAMPVALAVLLVLAVLATAAAAAAISSSHQSYRQKSTKRSFQAAVAGVQAANYQTTLLRPSLQQCVVKNPSTGALSLAAVQADGWCAPQLETLGDGETYSQRVSAGTLIQSNGQELVRREIVSTGLVSGVRRRVDVTTTATSGKKVFPNGYAAVSLAPVSYGNTVKVNGGLGSNGQIALDNEAVICGNATPGPNEQVTTANQGHVCTGYSTTPAQLPFVLNPVDPTPQDSNGRITNIFSGTSPSDACTNCNKVSWNESTRVLALSGNSTLTLGGSVYSFCKVTLENSAQLKIAVNAAVKIYIDSPEHCGGAGMGSVTLSNTSGILNLNSSPLALQLYMVGSPTIPTTLDFANSFASTIIMAIYAPFSTVNLHNSVHITGAVAAASVPIQNDSSITYDPAVGGIYEGVIPAYKSTRNLVECTATPTGTAVNSGC